MRYISSQLVVERYVTREACLQNGIDVVCEIVEIDRRRGGEVTKSRTIGNIHRKVVGHPCLFL